MFGASAAVTLLVPAALRAQAARLDPAFPHGPVRLHLSALPGRIGAAAFAADVRNLVSEWGIDVLLPMTEQTHNALFAHPDLFAAGEEMRGHANHAKRSERKTDHGQIDGD